MPVISHAAYTAMYNPFSSFRNNVTETLCSEIRFVIHNLASLRTKILNKYYENTHVDIKSKVNVLKEMIDMHANLLNCNVLESHDVDCIINEICDN